jgi:two-component system, cell cycle sensor histidine kinase and response regulator CckA
MTSAVMVVEDEPLIATDIVDTLTQMGYDVTGTAASALECVQAAEKRRPDLVLMDINLSGELDGIDAARILRERFDIPVVFLSGYADDRTINRAKLTGALGYLLKPFRRSELKSAVEVGLFRNGLERQLKDRERWLATTLRAIGDAAIAVDPAGRVSFMNAAAEKLVNVSEAAARGRPLDGLVRLLNEKTRQPLADPLQQVLQSGADMRLPRHTALLAAGLELPVDFGVAPIVDEQGAILGAVAVIKDLTEERRAQQQVAVADRLASLGAVAAGIAHEINNPLTYVLGNVAFLAEELGNLQRLLESKKASEDIQDVLDSMHSFGALLQEVEEGATCVGHIAGDLSFFGRRDAGPQRCDVVAPLEWALRVSHSAVTRCARVKRAFCPVPEVCVDEGRLGQVFLNLILNAAYAMRDTDLATNELTVSIELARTGAPADAPLIRITIADTGCGMTADVMRRIFDPFFTTKPVDAGTGLGLSVCHGMVAEMGGDISVTSTPGKGSQFVVSLPPADPAEVAPESVQTLAGLRGRVLIIDDDSRVLGVLCRMLASVHDVLTSQGARAALDILRAGPAVDVILCDLLMPDMNGMEFYRELERQAPSLAARVIFLSGGANAELTAEFFQSIPNPAIQKPPSKVELLRAIECQLSSARRDPVLAAPRTRSPRKPLPGSG